MSKFNKEVNITAEIGELSVKYESATGDIVVWDEHNAINFANLEDFREFLDLGMRVYHEASDTNVNKKRPPINTPLTRAENAKR